MKIYKAPVIRMIELDDEECIIATSDPALHSKMADDDNAENQFSKMLNIVNMGDDEAMSWE